MNFYLLPQIKISLLVLFFSLKVDYADVNFDAIRQCSRATNRKQNHAYLNWKTYSNENLNLQFKYPPTYKKEDKDIDVTDRNGIITSTVITFLDTLSKSSFVLEYHFAPNGKVIYDFALKNLNLDKNKEFYKTIKIDGNDAVQLTKTIRVNGKGKELTSPLCAIVIDFMDKVKSDCIEFQFQTEAKNSKIEISNFSKLIESFKFLL